MGFFKPDVYAQPEKFGLRLIGTVDWSDEPYQFDMTIVLCDDVGILYWASDSGCSCPSPFEDFTSIQELETGTVQDLSEALLQRVREGLTRDQSRASVEVVDVLTRVNLEKMGTWGSTAA